MRFFLAIGLIWAGLTSKSQKIESIYFHLYTDSLKKGVHNYINVDGKLSNGRYLPLNSKQIIFSSSAGTWDGNSLIIDSSYTKDFVEVKAVLKENPDMFKNVIIYIKKKPDDEVLKSEKEILDKIRKGRSTNKKTKLGERLKFHFSLSLLINSKVLKHSLLQALF